jgi:putative transport protein
VEWLSTLLTDPNAISHIIFVYALLVSVGMALGRVKVFGISLGVTFVLFVALAAGYLGLSVNASVLNFVRDFGLILFVFFIGLQVGPSFFSAFKSSGITLNLLAVLAIVLSIVVTIILWVLFSQDIHLAQMLGVHFGAVTNTPGLGATQEALDMLSYTGENIAVAYACAYPLGVLGIIGSVIALRLFFGIDLKEEDKHWEQQEKSQNDAPIFFHVQITNEALEGRTIRQVRDFIGRQFICSRVLHDKEIYSPSPDSQLHLGDTVRIVSAKEHKLPITAFFGHEATDVDLATEHSPVTLRIVRVTKLSVNGIKVGDLHLSSYDGVNITRIIRAGITLFPAQDTHLQLGDVVYCVGPERALVRLAGRLGDQAQKLEKPNIAALFFGVCAGIIFGCMPIAIPGMPVPVKLGLAGGPLIIAILLGRFGPSLHLVTYTTTSANLMLREIGIALFMASVGLAAGPSFVKAITGGPGPMYAALGFCITVIPVLITGIVGRKYFGLNYHTLVGTIAGATTNPPTLAYAGTLSDKNPAVIAYSTVYPLSMFLRILTGQLVLVALWSFV